MIWASACLYTSIAIPMVKAVTNTMRIEYWARLRCKGGSWHVNVPAGEMTKLIKYMGLSQEPEKMLGLEVRVEVSV